MYLPKINKNKSDNRINKKIINQKSSSEENEEKETTETTTDAEPQAIFSNVVDKFISLFNDPNMISDCSLDFFQ